MQRQIIWNNGHIPSNVSQRDSLRVIYDRRSLDHAFGNRAVVGVENVLRPQNIWPLVKHVYVLDIGLVCWIDDRKVC